VEYSQYWSFDGHEARSDAEKDGLARDALEAKCSDSRNRGQTTFSGKRKRG